jgi:cold shock CspA family protein
MTDSVFISYAKEDQHAAVRLYRALKDAGVNPWLDIFDLVPGQLWAREIEKAISHSSYFIAIQSSRSVGKRGHVQKELRRALEIAEEYPEDKLYIIPVRLEECEPSFRALQKLHRVDLFPKYEDGINALLQVFSYRVGEKPPVMYIEEYPRLGEIKTLADRGFGFIKCLPFNKDIFFHSKDLAGVTFDELKVSDAISFYLARETYGLMATSLSRE